MGDKLSDLKHTSVKLNGGGEIIILDTGAVINAESEAMLQALHSRSTGGLRSHLEVLSKRGSEKFMDSFYVGYGHKSIGDCGTTTIFIEGVSMLVAKAIQDNPLYSGQEASTRYVDFSEQPFVDPTETQLGRDVLEMQRAFYMYAQEPTRQHLTALHPRAEGEQESIYEKAINARAFDITRGLLPAGASTNLAWHTNLRQAADRMLFLRHHPLTEVREMAEGLEEALKKHHPNSFGHKKYEKTEEYQDLIAASYYYHDLESPAEPVVDFRDFGVDGLSKYAQLFAKRPPKAELPKFLGQLGTLDARFSLDFGSFRDIQRHRAIIQRMPLLTADLGFNEWYIQNLPGEVRDNLPAHLNEVRKKIDGLEISREESQYFLPMGYNTSNRFTGDLPAVVYMVELRDSRFVHPTLQRAAHIIGKQIESKLDIPIHVDAEPNRFDIKRGGHDISLK